MTNIDQVYQTIVELQAEQGTDNDITYTTLQTHTGLSIDELRELVSALHEQGKIAVSDPLTSTGKDTYGQILEFIGIKAL